MVRDLAPQASVALGVQTCLWSSVDRHVALCALGHAVHLEQIMIIP